MNTEEEILKLKNSYSSYCYCIDNEETANIKAHEQIIIDSKNSDCDYCYYFARDIKNSNKELLFKALLQSGNFYYIKQFYKYINFDKTKYETLMLFI
jgi:hypothetical protein